MTLIKLLKAWSHGDEEFAVGTILEVDEDTAKALVADSTAEKAGDATVVKTVEVEKTTSTSGDGAETVTITSKDLNELIAKAAEAKAVTTGGDGKKGSGRPNIVKTHDNIYDDPNMGYRPFSEYGMGDFLLDTRKAHTPGVAYSTLPDRIKASASEAYSKRAKAVGSDEYATLEDAIGGFLIPPVWSDEILKKGVEDDWIRGYGARAIPIPSTMMTINAMTDETRVGELYGGMWCYRLKERGQMTATKGEWQKIELKPKALTAMAFATDAELNYAPVLQATIGSQFGDVMTYKQLDEGINGSGAGENQGVLNFGATYSQAKETGQAAATIETANVLKMRSHMRDQEYQKAVWLTSLSCMEQLNSLTMVVGVGGAPIGLVKIGDDGVSRLLGRPLIYTEFAKAIGTVGDLMCCSWPSYLIGEGTYSNVASSIHVRFDYNETAFRFVRHIDAQCWWRTTLTLANSWEVAPFVTLATRS